MNGKDGNVAFALAEQVRGWRQVARSITTILCMPLRNCWGSKTDCGVAVLGITGSAGRMARARSLMVTRPTGTRVIDGDTDLPCWRRTSATLRAFASGYTRIDWMRRRRMMSRMRVSARAARGTRSRSRRVRAPVASGEVHQRTDPRSGGEAGEDLFNGPQVGQHRRLTAHDIANRQTGEAWGGKRTPRRWHTNDEPAKNPSHTPPSEPVTMSSVSPARSARPHSTRAGLPAHVRSP